MLCTIDDPIHSTTSTSLNHWYYLPDILLSISIAILILTLVTSYVSTCMLSVVLVLYLIIMGCRETWARYVYPCTMPETYPGRNADRYIITGHLLAVGLIAYIVVRSTAPSPIKVSAVGIAIIMGLISVITREHYTVDVAVTLPLIFAVIAITWSM